MIIIPHITRTADDFKTSNTIPVTPYDIGCRESAVAVIKAITLPLIFASSIFWNKTIKIILIMFKLNPIKKRVKSEKLNFIITPIEKNAPPIIIKFITRSFKVDGSFLLFDKKIIPINIPNPKALIIYPIPDAPFAKIPSAILGIIIDIDEKKKLTIMIGNISFLIKGFFNIILNPSIISFKIFSPLLITDLNLTLKIKNMDIKNDIPLHRNAMGTPIAAMSRLPNNGPNTELAAPLNWFIAFAFVRCSLPTRSGIIARAEGLKKALAREITIVADINKV